MNRRTFFHRTAAALMAVTLARSLGAREVTQPKIPEAKQVTVIPISDEGDIRFNLSKDGEREHVPLFVYEKTPQGEFARKNPEYFRATHSIKLYKFPNGAFEFYVTDLRTGECTFDGTMKEGKV